jgi:hypothetical protein
VSHVYRIAGMTVSSEIPLPGARPDAWTGVCDVVMRQAPTPVHLDNPDISRPSWEAGQDQYLMRAPGVARFLLSGGREIIFETEPGTPPTDCAAYLLGSIFGALLHQRRLIVMHASAVQADGKAVMFCGRSGLGKSTLAAALSQRGWPLLGDDVSAIAFDGEGLPCLQADTRQLKLTAESIAALDLGARRGAAILRRATKYFVEPLESVDSGACPLGAVYVLAFDPQAAAARIDRLNAAEALRGLRGDAYRPAIVRRTGQTQRYFEAAAMIASKVPVCRLTRGPHLIALPQLADLVQAHWRDLASTQGSNGDV